MSEPNRPYTAAEYPDSLRDGREVWIYGERVKDVTTHPAFRNPARMLARLYDALHDPAQNIAVPTDTGNGGITHPFFKVSRTREELIAARDAIAAWARLTYGWMGRSPTRPSTASARRKKSPTCTCTASGKPTPASSCRAPRW